VIHDGETAVLTILSNCLHHFCLIYCRYQMLERFHTDGLHRHSHPKRKHFSTFGTSQDQCAVQQQNTRSKRSLFLPISVVIHFLSVNTQIHNKGKLCSGIRCSLPLQIKAVIHFRSSTPKFTTTTRTVCDVLS
jgi:hypothetical protein